VSIYLCKSGPPAPSIDQRTTIMSGASSLARKKRDRSARSQPPKRSPTAGFPTHPLRRLAAAHEACRAILADRAPSTMVQTLVTALRQIFQADVAVLRVGDGSTLEAVSPRGTDPRSWADWLNAHRASSPGTTGTHVVEAPDDRAATAGIDRILVVPLDVGARGALCLGYGKKAPSSSEDLVMFDMLGDYLALVLRQASAKTPPAEAGKGSSTDDLVSQAAHDLRTPLTPISMLLQTLERKAAAGAVDVESIGRARRQVQRLTDMVADLIDLARLREGRLLLEPAVLDLRDAFTRAARTFGERERRRTVDLALGDEPLWIVADTDRTAHAIASLLEHVARLSQGDAPVQVILERRDSSACLQICSERPPSTSGVRLELGAGSNAVHRTPPLGLGVRLADALFTRLGGTLQIAGTRDGSARIEGSFPLAPPPSGERTTASARPPVAS
jgi:K+-sensing histidine kinase KdpD